MPSPWLTGSSGDSVGERTSSELCGCTVPPTSVTSVLAQDTNTGPCFKVEELSVYSYKMNSKNEFLILKQKVYK